MVPFLCLKQKLLSSKIHFLNIWRYTDPIPGSMYDGGYMGVGLERMKNKKKKSDTFSKKHVTQSL